MASALITQFTRPNQIIYDPFSGCGTVGLEAWMANRRVIANDLSPYAYLLTKAKLFPYHSHRKASMRLQTIARRIGDRRVDDELRSVPSSVRRFFHPKTLREVVAWTSALAASKDDFLLACLLGILHHQRPGFLSYPSSHAVPYLRESKFPDTEFPELYAYRPLLPRLEAKLTRAFRRAPEVNFAADRKCFRNDASTFLPDSRIDAIITSPPYMRQLDYGRDNRLRLWFLGVTDADELDGRVSPNEHQFLALMKTCLTGWREILRRNSYCILVLGDTISRTYGKPLPQVIGEMAVVAVGGYTLEGTYADSIPIDRRVRRGCRGNLSETILVLKRTK